jgi:hypothetical protein
MTKNILAALAAASILASTLIASAAPIVPTATAKSCPPGSAIAQSAKIDPATGNIVVTTRCVK